MKKVFCTAFGKPSAVVEVREVPEPTAGPGEVLIAMHASPINPADLLLVTGRHFFRPTLPAAVGIEGAGTVVAVGAGVTELVPGDRVALPFGGTWAERMVMSARDVVLLPRNVDLTQAAMLSVNPVTAMCLVAGLSAGDWLIQNAANSAVGRLIIRLAAQRGLRTVNVVRRAELSDELRALGAHVVVVDGDGEDLAERVARATGGEPVRRALDAVAGPAAGRLLRCLGDGGTLMCYGLLDSDDVVFPASQVVFRDVTITGFSRLRVLRSMPQGQLQALYAELAALIQDGTLTTAVEAVYPLDRLAEALDSAEQGGRTGKIVLDLGMAVQHAPGA